MKIIFSHTTEKGGRPNNEDAVYPAGKDSEAVNGLFMVCDGVGGASKGQIASALTISTIAGHMQNSKAFTGEPEQHIQAAIQAAELQIRNYEQLHPGSAGMATTLAMLYLQDSNRAVIAHVGDSRVYYIRNGTILFSTRDHSLVAELVEHGFLTPEQADNHPRRNIITRSVNGTGEPVSADFMEINDLQPGDCFLLCSDGILEGIDEGFLSSNLNNKMIGSEKNVQDVMDRIGQICSQRSSDNYSAILVWIKEVDNDETG